MPPIAIGATLVAAGAGGLTSVGIPSLNTYLRGGYAALLAWGIASIVLGFTNTEPDNVAPRLNLVIFMILSTVAHLGVTAAGPLFVEGLIRYSEQPKLLYQSSDVLMLLSLITVLIFFFDPDGLFTVALSGGIVTTLTLGVQFYKVSTIVQGIETGERSSLTAKLKTDIE